MISPYNNLKEWQISHPRGFESVAIDISGFCNAKCKYCPAGNDLSHKGEFVTLENYRKILERLISCKMLTSDSELHLYCLGEPLLHPQFNDILSITSSVSLKVNISTNGSIVPYIDENNTKDIKRVLVSVPGFSQASYDRIHGFNFEKIKENIKTIRKQLAEIPFDMSFHIYQFNINEMEDARTFCEENDIRFSPNYAVMFDKSKCFSYVDNTMSYEELKDISKEIFLGVLDYQISKAPGDYCDFQENFLSVTINGDMRICSSFTKDREEKILCGNLLHDDIDILISRKYNFSLCEECKKKGLTLNKGRDCKIWPDSYYSLMRENEFLNESHVSSDKHQLNNELRLMRELRKWEAMDCADSGKDNIMALVTSLGLSQEKLNHTIIRYCRFPDQTRKCLDLAEGRGDGL